MADRIFLNHHSQSPPCKKLLTQFSEDLHSHWFMGPIQNAKNKIFEILGSRAEITFKTNLAQCHHQVIFSHYMHSIRQTGRTHILSIPNEQKSILDAIRQLETFDVQGKLLPTNEKGQLTAESLQESLRARSSLLSLSWAHPKTGIIQPIHDLIRVCKENDVKVHLDLSAAIGKIFFQLIDFDVDYITFDGGLLGMPIPLGIILSREKMGENYPFAYFSSLASALSMAFDEIENYAMQTPFLRDVLESKLEEFPGVEIPYKEVDRLPNVAVARFDKIHSEQILQALRQEAIFADAIDPFSISFALSVQTKQEEIDRVIAAFGPILQKLQTKPRMYSKQDAEAKNMRLCQAKVDELSKGREFTLQLLIDEEDGIIADAKYQAFAPPSFHHLAETGCAELLRKNYMQARRITADFLEKKLKSPAEDIDFNLLIDAIDIATENCMDIPIEDIYTAPPEMDGGERTVYPNWEELSNDQKKKIISEVIDSDVRPYVELDAGGVEVIKVEENRVTIAYSGNCTSCFSATGATLEAIGGILRHKIFPDLMIVPDTSLLQN